MREKYVFNEIIDVGKRRGVLTYDEINEALPSEFLRITLGPEQRSVQTSSGPEAWLWLRPPD